ncbi:mandelate racemase/muconate lactonizing enzyme family protein [Arsenicitalea aurantiaca]|uniref:Mandelate racemase/muconate lactonizing enzyme family protein n=1 Tax=Arsenicitalea aurantiaca TaxID=1783274 RepID=A0A433XMH2_9HYPH|nr:mandelate racemase/muconate lactonizing enzyme family protein [Arsenicitalea aurantiaca]
MQIADIRCHPLRVQLPVPQRTSQGDWESLDIVVVEVETADGIVGIGEGLARRSSAAYALMIDEILAPRVIGCHAMDRRAIWRSMRSALTGRPGTQMLEAMAAIDIALWDIAGKALNQPVYRLLGGVGRTHLPAYASSINWLDDETVAREVGSALEAGFRQIKVKLGGTPAQSIARARYVRGLVPDDVALCADANWAFDVHEAIRVGFALWDLGYDFFEEPIAPEDRDGYRTLARQLPIRLAAGESDSVASDVLEFLHDRSLGLIQPDVARSGGITETWRMAELAAAHNVAYAPHVGWSGAVCAAASLHLAAAAESFRTYECMVFDNPLRQALCTPLLGDVRCLENGMLAVPQTPGLGVEFDRDALREFTRRPER